MLDDYKGKSYNHFQMLDGYKGYDIMSYGFGTEIKTLGLFPCCVFVTCNRTILGLSQTSY